MSDVLTTGQAAIFLGIPEHRLNEHVRKGRVSPAPKVVSGRRFWEEQHLRKAARAEGAVYPDGPPKHENRRALPADVWEVLEDLAGADVLRAELRARARAILDRHREARDGE